jgi:hypothetical protein
VPTRSVDLIITSLPNSWFTTRHLLSFLWWFLFLRRRCSVLGLSLSDLVQFLAFRSLFLGSSPTFVQFFALRSWTCFSADVCLILCLSLLDLFLVSSPFALGFVPCLFAVVCSAAASIIFIGFYTLVNAKNFFM